jgi:NTE family protein
MRALVLSGGAVHGAYQMGAIKYLVEDLGLEYDFFAGVSVGALNSAYMSLYPKGQEKNAVSNLYNIWMGIDNAKVRKNWFPFGVVSALWKDSLYNSQPLIDMVHNTVDVNKIRQANRQVAVGAVNMVTGDYRTFTQNDDFFADGVLASSSFPMGLCPIVINGDKYTDGGLKHIIPMQEAIDSGATDIDVIVCGPAKTTSKFNDVDVVTFGMRGFDLMCDQLTQADLKVSQLYNIIANAGLDPTRKYLNIKVIRPSEDLQLNSLSFDNPTIQKMIQQGYDEAKQQYK